MKIGGHVPDLNHGLRHDLMIVSSFYHVNSHSPPDVASGHPERGPSNEKMRVAESLSTCVLCEDTVASVDPLVAGKTGVVHGFVGGLAVVELSEPPPACPY